MGNGEGGAGVPGPQFRRSLELRCAAALALALLVFELLAPTGLSAAPHELAFQLFSLSPAGIAAGATHFGLFLFMYVCAGLGARELSVLLAVAAAAAVANHLLQRVAGPQWQPDLNAGIFAASLVGLCRAILIWRHDPDASQRQWSGRLLLGFVCVLMFGWATPHLLALTARLLPLTHDQELFRIDAVFGFIPSAVLGRWALEHEPAWTILDATYRYLPVLGAALYGAQLGRAQPPDLRVIKLLVVSAAAVVLAYFIYPVVGPAYAYGANFPYALPSPDQLPLEPAMVHSAARNGMPSMHFGWALGLWLLALRQSRTAGLIYFGAMVLTALATLATGEHYLLDLVVACPFMLAVFAGISNELPWPGMRRTLFITGAGLYAGWIALLLFAPALLLMAGILWLLTVLTVAASAWGLARLHQASRTAPPAAAPVTAPAVSSRLDVLVYLMFFVSGAAALIYQVLFSKYLAYVFGSMSTATNTVLATYMGGMALGALLGGGIAQRLRRPLAAYVACELAIAAYCAASPAIFNGVQAAYVALASGSDPGASRLLFLRVLLGGAALLAPTVLMGATLPVLARFFEQRASGFAPSVARLYAANTLGAALGALAAGYWIMPALGLRDSNLLAVGLDLGAAYLASVIMRRAPAPGDATVPAAPLTTAYAAGRHDSAVALTVLALGGFVTLALEVDFVHLLAVAAGNSVYAFSLMLFAFLVGLGGGAEGGRALMRRMPPLPLLLWLELGLAAAILFGVRQIDAIPGYFASFAGYPPSLGFASREVIRGLVCCVAMIPASCMIGAIFPVSIACLTRGGGQPVRMLGIATSLNTTGNILGVLVGGFILLPSIGPLRTAHLLAGLCLVLATLAAAASGEWRRWPAAAALAALCGSLALQPAQLDYDALTTGANVYFAAQQRGQVIDHAESLDGGLTTINQSPNDDGTSTLTLLTNGKFQGNNSRKGEMVAQAGFALAPLLHTAKRDAALVVGYGTGNTSHVLQAAGFARLDIAELSADVYRMANTYLGEVNHGVTVQPQVHAYVTDGRNLLLLSPQKYDLISMEVTSIWFAGAASLYSRDFYQLAKSRLNPDGVLQQWVQLHHATPLDLCYVLGSLRAEFRYLWVYVIGGQGVIVASDSAAAAPDAAKLAALDATPALKPELESHAGSAAQVRDLLLLDPEAVDRLVFPRGAKLNAYISTDDNAHLEYSTPRGNVLDGPGSQKFNIRFLRLFTAAP